MLQMDVLPSDKGPSLYLPQRFPCADHHTLWRKPTSSTLGSWGRVPVNRLLQILSQQGYVTQVGSTIYTTTKQSCWVSEPYCSQSCPSNAASCWHVTGILGICCHYSCTCLKLSTLTGCWICICLQTPIEISTRPLLPLHLQLLSICPHYYSTNKIWPNITKTHVHRLWQFHKGVYINYGINCHTQLS